MTRFAGIELPDRHYIDLPDLETARALQAATDAAVALPRRGSRPVGFEYLTPGSGTITQTTLESQANGTVRYLAFESGASIAYLRQLWTDFKSFETGPLHGLTSEYTPRRADHYFDRAGRALREILHDLSPVLARDAIHVIAIEQIGDSLRALNGEISARYNQEVVPRQDTLRETLASIASNASLRLLATPLWWKTSDAEAAVVFVAQQALWKRLPALQPRASITGLPRSLPEAVVFLLAAELSWKDPLYHDSDLSRSVLGRAARLLLAIATRLPTQEAPAFHLFDTLDQLARAKYERRATRAWLAFMAFDAVSWAVRLAKPVHITQQRMVRKLLESAGSENAVLTDGEHVAGIASVSEVRRIGTRGVVRFRADGSWDFYEQIPRRRQRPIFRVMHGSPSLAAGAAIERAALDSAWSQLPGVSTTTRQGIWELCATATEHGHGALIIILSGHAAAVEVTRLGSQAVTIDPVPVTKQLAPLTYVDGALFVDCAGICHAFAVILDGLASDSCGGDASRGSRYNSAVRYVESQRIQGRQVVAIVVSEDGMVDVLPARDE